MPADSNEVTPGFGGSGAATAPEWERVLHTPAFRQLMKKKKNFIVPAVAFFTVFFLAWPVLGGFTTVLDGAAIGGMTWGYVYGFAQFPVMLILLHLYQRQAAGWDVLAARALVEANHEDA